MQRLFLTIVIMTVSGQAAANTNGPEQEKFDLKKAISFAVANSPSFDSIKRQLDIARLDEKSAEAKLLPSVDLTATHGLLGYSSHSTTNPWSSEFSLSISQPLYDNGLAPTNRTISSLIREKSELIFEDEKNRMALDIASQFLNYSLSVKLLDVQQKQFSLTSKQYERISRDYHQGVKTKKDFVRFKTQLSRAEINLVAAKSAIEKSKQELYKLIGINLKSQTPVDFEPISLDALQNEIPPMNLGIDDHLTYKATQIQKEINKLNADLVGKKNLPELYLSTGVNYTSSNYIGAGQSFSDNAKTNWEALLTVKYNLFDWGIRSRDKQAALFKSIIQNNDLDTSLLHLNANLKQLAINARQIEKSFALAKELLALERENLDVVEREYRSGKLPYLDLITGLNNAADAEIKFYSAACELQSTKHAILYHQGRLYEELLK